MGKTRKTPITPNTNGCWWAELENGTTEFFRVEKHGKAFFALHGNWVTIQHIEKSFKVKCWRGETRAPK